MQCNLNIRTFYSLIKSLCSFRFKILQKNIGKFPSILIQFFYILKLTMPWYSRKCQTNVSQTSGGCQIFLGSIVVQVLVDLRCLRLGLIVGRSLSLWRSTFNLFRNKILKLNIFKFNCNRNKMYSYNDLILEHYTALQCQTYLFSKGFFDAKL